MLAHLAQASRRPATQAATASRSCLTVAPRRHYAQKSEGGPEDPFKAGPSYAQWLRTEGIKYKEAHRPKNWLGGEVVEFVLSASRLWTRLLTVHCRVTCSPFR